jgi:hypothetical protein
MASAADYFGENRSEVGCPGDGDEDEDRANKSVLFHGEMWKLVALPARLGTIGPRVSAVGLAEYFCPSSI